MGKKIVNKYLSLVFTTAVIASIFYGCGKDKDFPVTNDIDTDMKLEEQITNENEIEVEESIKIEKLTEEQVRQIAINAKEALSNIIDVLNFDSNSMIVEDGRSFAISNMYKSKEDIINNLKEFYTKEAIDNFINNQTIEKNDSFYIIYGQGGIGLSINEDEVFIEQSNDSLTAIFSKKISEDFIVRQQYEFVKINNKWLRTDITLYS